MAPAIAPLPPYPSFLALAIAVGGACCAVSLRREGVAVARVAVLLAVAGLAALTGAKLFSAVERSGVVWWDPAWELLHGYRHPGAILALAAVAPLLRRLLPEWLTLLRAGDLLAPAMALAMVAVRLGCHFAGCCHGIATALPWAVRFAPRTPAWHAHVDRGWIDVAAPASVAVHPLQLYFAASSLALAVFLRHLSGRRGAGRRDGEVLCWFLVLDGLGKLVLEQFRMVGRPALAWSAALFAVAGGVGIAILRGGANPAGRE